MHRGTLKKLPTVFNYLPNKQVSYHLPPLLLHSVWSGWPCKCHNFIKVKSPPQTQTQTQGWIKIGSLCLDRQGIVWVNETGEAVCLGGLRPWIKGRSSAKKAFCPLSLLPSCYKHIMPGAGVVILRPWKWNMRSRAITGRMVGQKELETLGAAVKQLRQLQQLSTSGIPVMCKKSTPICLRHLGRFPVTSGQSIPFTLTEPVSSHSCVLWDFSISQYMPPTRGPRPKGLLL